MQTKPDKGARGRRVTMKCAGKVSCTRPRQVISRRLTAESENLEAPHLISRKEIRACEVLKV